jgi:hypothetical protein
MAVMAKQPTLQHCTETALVCIVASSPFTYTFLTTSKFFLTQMMASVSINLDRCLRTYVFDEGRSWLGGVSVSEQQKA